MSHNQRMDRTLLSLLPEDLEDMRILDVGFGYGLNGLAIRTRKTGTPYLEGIDIFNPYVETQKKLGIFDKVIQGDARKLPYESQSFDIVLATAIIEHLEQKEGLNLLEELERVSKNTIIVSTPYGYAPQEACDENPHQKHLSGWIHEDFEEKGYTTITIDDELTRSIKLIDNLRRKIFNLPQRSRYIIAHKILRCSIPTTASTMPLFCELSDKEK